MTDVTTNDLARMRDDAESTMRDRCEVGRWTSLGEDERGQEKFSFTYGAEIRCGFKPGGGSQGGGQREVMPGSETSMYEATFRLPVGTVIENVDRLKLTKRYGEALGKPEYFSVVGTPFLGPTALVVRVNREVTTDGQ